jgi:hypothetical protein
VSSLSGSRDIKFSKLVPFFLAHPVYSAGFLQGAGQGPVEEPGLSYGAGGGVRRVVVREESSLPVRLGAALRVGPGLPGTGSRGGAPENFLLFLARNCYQNDYFCTNFFAGIR